jgi:hypothetical protein
MAGSDPLGDLIKKIDEIQPLAVAVASLKASTVEQETEALTSILEKIKPLLAVAAHQIKNNCYTSGQQFSKEHVEYHAQKGLLLIDSFDQECTDRDTRGDYVGWQLVLFKDGHFGTQERAGDWSRWQGESSGWHITEEEDILSGIASELSEASEKLKGRKKSYEERLATITRIKEVMQ